MARFGSFDNGTCKRLFSLHNLEMGQIVKFKLVTKTVSTAKTYLIV